MIKIHSENNINISKPSFAAHQYPNTNSLQNDTVNFSCIEKNDDDCATQNTFLAGVNIFAKIAQCIKDFFDAKNKNTLSDSQEVTDWESEEIWAEESEAITSSEFEQMSEAARKIAAKNPGMSAKEAEEIAAAVAEDDRIIEALIRKEIQEAIAKQKPMFTEYSDEELKEMFSDNENKNPENRQEHFDYLIGKVYKDLRESGNYTEEDSINCNFGKLNPFGYPARTGVFCYPKDGWYWHKISGCQQLGNDRVSLSVRADEDLLQELDTLLLDGTYYVNGEMRFVPYDKHTKGYYKTSDSVSDWCKRHDPITMYFDEKVSQEMLEAIADITRFHRRIPNRKLPGTIPDKPWIANEPYTTPYQIDSLVVEANEVDKDLARAIRKYLGKQPSTGMYHSCVKLLEDYKRYKAI